MSSSTSNPVALRRCAASSTSKVSALEKAYGLRFTYKVGNLHCRKSSNKKCISKCLFSEDEVGLCSVWLDCRKQLAPFQRVKRMRRVSSFVFPDDGVTVNGFSQTNVTQTMTKHDENIQLEDLSARFVQSIHEAARTIELAFLEHIVSSKRSWLPKAWLGDDKNVWIKTLSYQCAVDCLLQAIIEIATRWNGRDSDIDVFVQRRLTKLRAPLQAVIQEQISLKQPSLDEWYFSNQSPLVVNKFVNLFEEEPQFSAATKIGDPAIARECDISLLTLGLSGLGAITKLGSTKIMCPPFVSMAPDIISRLMDKILEFIPISQAYQLTKDIGLHREFLVHFGPQAALAFSSDKCKDEERLFWVDLVQNQLLQAVGREKLWSRLITRECIEVLEKDLAIFGFFIAFGRSSQVFLSSYNFTFLDEPISDVIRYLIGGSSLFYSQLSSISSYQLYVEVVCEELEWLPFYYSASTDILTDGRAEEMLKLEAVSRVLELCACWMNTFMKYSTWLHDPSNAKAASFLSRGFAMVDDCLKDLRGKKESLAADNLGSLEEERRLTIESDLGSFEKALESVEEALVRLENLFQELHLCSSESSKEDLKAACSDLERIRRLKKEAELLEASFRAKAGMQSESFSSADIDDENLAEEAVEGEKSHTQEDRVQKKDKPNILWTFFTGSSIKENDEDQNPTAKEDENLSPDDVRRFEQLSNELVELENKVQRSADDAQNKKHMVVSDGNANKHNAIAVPMEKIKETSLNLLQGTQLLAIDTAAALVLLKRSMTGDELTEKEKKALKRTLTDLASVVPIGILMLLPVTAVGHAAILAFINRYAPSMIPSTYAPERLNLLRQLEKVKEMELKEKDHSETVQS